MSNFPPGTLNIMNDISRLNNDLLLKAEVSDETQAKFAATTFLELDRNLHSGQTIIVTGKNDGAGKIRMSDARAAQPSDFTNEVFNSFTTNTLVKLMTEGLSKRRKRRIRGKIKERRKKNR